jgi:hypothetical protein
MTVAVCLEIGLTISDLNGLIDAIDILFEEK